MAVDDAGISGQLSAPEGVADDRDWLSHIVEIERPAKCRCDAKERAETPASRRSRSRAQPHRAQSASGLSHPPLRARPAIQHAGARLRRWHSPPCVELPWADRSGSRPTVTSASGFVNGGGVSSTASTTAKIDAPAPSVSDSVRTAAAAPAAERRMLRERCKRSRRMRAVYPAALIDTTRPMLYDAK
jgi:hypothetical protein